MLMKTESSFCNRTLNQSLLGKLGLNRSVLQNETNLSIISESNEKLLNSPVYKRQPKSNQIYLGP